MTTYGHIVEIWRYPVKSMGGEKLESCRLGPHGLDGDRGWAVRDEQVGEIRGAKNIPRLMMCDARYLEEPIADHIPPVQISLPDGSTFRSDEPDANDKLSAFLLREVTLWPLQPASDAEHYRRKEALGDEAALKDFLSRETDESLPDLSNFDPALVQEIVEYAAPRGTYFDVGPFHLLTTASVAALQALLPEAKIDVRRFRPNIYIQPADGVEGFVEFEWEGKTLQVGDIRMTAGIPVPRCGMTACAQPDLPKDASILRTIIREAGQNLGIYGDTRETGMVRVGDAVEAS